MAKIKNDKSQIRRDGKTVRLDVVQYGCRAALAQDDDGKLYITTRDSNDNWRPWQPARLGA